MFVEPPLQQQSRGNSSCPKIELMSAHQFASKVSTKQKRITHGTKLVLSLTFSAVIRLSGFCAISSSPPPPLPAAALALVLLPKGDALTPCPALAGLLEDVEDLNKVLDEPLADPPMTFTTRAKPESVEPDPESAELAFDGVGLAGLGFAPTPFTAEDWGSLPPNPYPSRTALTISHLLLASLTSLAIVSNTSFALIRFGRSG